MLPFLKLKKSGVSGLIIKNRSSGEQQEEQPKEENNDLYLEACMQGIINSVRDNDAQMGVKCLRMAFELLDSEPHIEGEHVNPHSYDAQNQKAGENK
jgi:hypothetical protein